MKTLVVYYSFTQNNEKLANYIKSKLDCDIVKLETVKKRTGMSILLDLVFNRKPQLKPVPYYLRDYDYTIFIGPVWAGKIAMPLKSFLLQEKDNLRHYSFVTLCGGGNVDQKGRIISELQETTGKTPKKVVELWIKDLLSPEKMNSIKNTSGYRVDLDDLLKFDEQIQEVVDVAKALVIE